MKPLALDLCCGLGGWAEGLIAAGWRVIGYDVNEDFRSVYPGRFVCADVREIALNYAASGIAWRSSPDRPALVVASPPCPEYSRHDQPWTKRKNPPLPDKSIWEACERIAAEAGAPLILENVRGAQMFHGRAAWHVGPYYLWGNVPALMPRHLPGTSKGFHWWGSDGVRGREMGEYRKKESRTSAAQSERAKIPFELAHYIGQVFHPGEERVT